MRPSLFKSKEKIFKAIGFAIIAGLFSGFVAIRLTAQTPPQKMQSRALPVRTVVVKLQPGYYASRSFTGRAIAGRTSRMAFERSGISTLMRFSTGTFLSQRYCCPICTDSGEFLFTMTATSAGLIVESDTAGIRSKIKITSILNSILLSSFLSRFSGLSPFYSGPKCPTAYRKPPILFQLFKSIFIILPGTAADLPNYLLFPECSLNHFAASSRETFLTAIFMVNLSSSSCEAFKLCPLICRKIAEAVIAVLLFPSIKG